MSGSGSASLVSPGVKVNIINNAFTGTATAGTVPLIVLATAANKKAPSGTGIAPYTVPSAANTLYLATSQRDLLTNFGNPIFQSIQGTPVNGSELNEYGLHAAYSFLGLSNQCYVLRADIDLNQLQASTSPPTSAPPAGTYWFNLSSTKFGVFMSNGNALPGSAWVSQTVLVPTLSEVNGSTFVPISGFGSNGNLAFVPWTSNNLLYQKIGGTWYQVGSSAWLSQNPTTVTGVVSPSAVTSGDEFSINGSTVTLSGTNLASVVTSINNNSITNITASVVNNALVITNTVGGSITLANISGTSFTTLGLVAGTTNGVQLYFTNNAQYPTNSVSGSIWIKESSSNNGANWIVEYYSSTTNSFITLSAPFYQYNSALSDGTSGKDTAAIAALGTGIAVGNLYVGYDPTTGSQQIRRWNGTYWAALSYQADTVAPTSPPVAGTYWYNADIRADIMYGTGEQWVGYCEQFPETDPNGVQISGSAPTTQSTGAALVNNDLWIDSSDTENYPLIYRYSTSSSSWVLIDNTDTTSPFGIIFADARADSGPSYSGQTGVYNNNSQLSADMALSSYVDPDCPNPEFYPAGMLLFNSRYAYGNVKEWNPTYFNAGGYDPNTNYTQTGYNIGTAEFPALTSASRWVTASGNMESGAPYFLRKAQRVMVVQSLASAINSNQDILSELVYYNLIAVPGYIELLSDMVTLNTNQNNVAFIVADSPARLDPSSNSVSNFANNTANVPIDSESGLVTHSDYAAMYYPWGLGQDTSGNPQFVPPSTLALRTIAYSDQISYQWFAPAGFTRGLITNATSVGYLITSTINGGTYQPVILNQGQRDTLYTNSINPIAYITGRGLVIYGQKTLATDSSLLDRINVARLACYLSYNLDQITKPYLFEQNDQTTRNAVSNTVSQFLNQLVGLRGISDYAVVCDTSNNTAVEIDNNQLWVDVLVLPLTAVEFIYIPVRIESNSSYSSAAAAVTSTTSSLPNNINVSSSS
jgi:hypothetical protein